MPVYRPKNSPYWYAEFQLDGHRVHKSTKTTAKKEAEAVEREWKEKLRQDTKVAKITGNGPLTLNLAAGRFWTEKGQHHSGSGDTWANLERLLKYFGGDKRLDEITDRDIAALVAWRRIQTKHGKKNGKDGKPVPAISNATVNRTTVVILRAVFSRARRVWKYQFPLEPDWRSHMLDEPPERVRELDAHEAVALDTAVRKDYALWFQFARLTGLRLNETLIRWKNVNIFAKVITTIGKRGKTVSTPITPSIAAILDQCRGRHDEWVFTYEAKRSWNGKIKGEFYPLTYEGCKTEWQRLRKRSDVQGFRFHDIRHDVGTKLLRRTGNMKLAQKALNHSDLKTTARYAHVLMDEVAEALEGLAKAHNKAHEKNTDSA